MSLFAFLLRSNARKVAVAILVSVLSGASSALLVALVHRVWAWGAYSSGVWMVRFAVVLVTLIASGFLAQMMVLGLSLRAIADLRLQLSAKIVATPLEHLEKLGFGRLLAVLADDVSAVSRVLPNVPRVVIDVTTILGGLAYMAWLSWQALLVICLFVAVGILVYQSLTRRSLGYMKRGREVYDSLFELFRGLHDGIKQLKLSRLRRQDFLHQELGTALESYRSLNMRGRTLLIGAENITRLVFFLLLGMLMFVVPRLGDADRQVLTGYVLMALYLYRPLGSLMALVPDVSRAAVSLQKIESLGLSLDRGQADTRAVLEVQPCAAPAPRWQRLELRGVSYSHHRPHEDTYFTLGPLDLSFVPGELVFVLGGNGSGKTTLAKVLTSLYPAQQGQLLLDGVPVSDENREAYRELFTVVFTDSYLFSRLVPGQDAAELERQATLYLKRLQLDHKVQVRDGQFTTTTLSTGQRKRLLLLCAYLEDRPFYVLDEWAADQDPQFKETFYTEILPALKARGKTVVVITHDDRYTYVADRCLKLEDGKLVEEAALASIGKRKP